MLARVLTFDGMSIDLGCLNIEGKNVYMAFGNPESDYTKSVLFQARDALDLDFVTESLTDDKVIEEYKNAEFTVNTRFNTVNVTLSQYLTGISIQPYGVTCNDVYRILLTLWVLYKLNDTTSTLAILSNDSSYLSRESGIYLKFVKARFTGTEFEISVTQQNDADVVLKATMTIEEIEGIVKETHSLLAMTHWMTKHFNNKGE